MNENYFFVIMPVYNSEKYLQQAIDSLEAQTFKKWTLIAMDDGSTDSSLSILKENEKKDERIKVFSVEHLGSAADVRSYAAKRSAEFLSQGGGA